LNFGKLKNPDTRLLHGADSADFMMLGCLVLTKCSSVTDGQTDTFAITKTGICVAICAEAV